MSTVSLDTVSAVHSHTESQDWLKQGISHTLNRAYNVQSRTKYLARVSTQVFANSHTQSIKYQSTYRVTTNLHTQDYDRKQTMVQPHTLNQITTLHVSQSYNLIRFTNLQPHTFHNVTTSSICISKVPSLIAGKRENKKWEMKKMRNERNEKWEVGEMRSGRNEKWETREIRNEKQEKWEVREMRSGRNEKWEMRKWEVGEMRSGRNEKWEKWEVGEIRNEKWQVREMRSGRNEKWEMRSEKMRSGRNKKWEVRNEKWEKWEVGKMRNEKMRNEKMRSGRNEKWEVIDEATDLLLQQRISNTTWTHITFESR